MKHGMIIAIAVVCVVLAAAAAVIVLDDRTQNRPTPKDFTDFIPITSVNDLIKIGSDEEYDLSRTWSLDERYYLVNNIDFGSTDTNGGVNIGYTVTISGTSLTVTISIEGGGTANTLGAFIGYRTGSVNNNNTLTLTDIPQPSGGYTLTICGRAGTTDFAYSTLINTSAASHSGSFSSNGNFTPIGTEAAPFTGVFDGNGKAISGMNVALLASAGGWVNGGLFGTAKDAAIMDTKVTNSSVTVASPTGTYPSASGGIVGKAIVSASQAMTITDCSFSGSITISLRGSHSTQRDAFAGGIVGNVAQGAAGGVYTISGCRSEGRITTTSPTEAVGGGIIGSVFSTANLTVDGCVSNININAYGSESIPAGLAGGIVGRLWTGAARILITDCVNNGSLAVQISGEDLSYSFAGGIAGYSETGNFSIIDCRNTGSVSTTVLSGPSYDTRSVSGGIVGYAMNSIEIKDCVNTGEILTTASIATSYATAGGMIGQTSGSGKMYITGCRNSAPVTLSPTAAASYSGAGGAVGLVINSGAGAMTITDTHNSGTITASLPSSAMAGGIVGRTSGTSTISECSNTAPVNGTSTAGGAYIGGISGYTYSFTSIMKCNNAAPVTASAVTGVYAGGISGVTYISTRIAESYNTGQVTGTSSTTASYVGGIIGTFSSSSDTTVATLTDCYNTASVSATAATTAAAGGTAGYLNPVSPTIMKVSNAYNIGTVAATGTNQYAGGIAGYSASSASKITNCYFLEGKITIGGAAFEDRICHTGSVTIDGDRTTSRPDVQWSGAKTGAQMTPALAAAKNNESIYNTEVTEVGTSFIDGWDFNEIWTIISGVNGGYPVLDIVEPDPEVSLTGTVKEGTVPLSGVTISYNGTSVTTNSEGKYAVSLPKGSSVTITGVTLTDYTVNETLPVTMTMDGDKVQDFTMTPNSGPVVPKYSISGKVTHGSTPLQDVKILYTISGKAGTAVTDAGGNYIVSDIKSGSSVRITAVIKTGYSVVEAMPGSFYIASDRTFNFTMLPEPSYILSGTVTDGADPLGNVKITYNGGATSTDNNGKYYISAKGGTNLTILEVTLSGYTVNEGLPVSFAMSEDKVQDFTMKADEAKQDMMLYYAAALILLLVLLLIILVWFFRRSYEVVKTGSAGIIGKDRARRKKEYVFSLDGEPGQAVYRVGEDTEWIALTPNEDGSYAIPKERVIDKLTIERR